jgi:Fe2+ transport system protein B
MEKLGEEGSEALAAVLNEHGKEAENSVIKTAAQRFEKKLSEEISGVRLEMAESEKRFEKKLSEEISGVRLELAESEKRFEKKLSEEISGVRIELAESEKRFEKKLSEEISGVREEMVRGDCALQKEIQKSKTDTVKWMFIFWIGQIGALLGILFMVFK